MARRKKQSSALSLLADAYLALLMTVMVFACTGQGYLTLQNDKWTVFLFLTGGYVGLSILLWLEEVLTGLRAPSELKEAVRSASWVHRLMAVYLIWTLLSALLSPYGSAAWRGATRNEGALTIALYVLSFSLLSRFSRPKGWMLWALGVTVTLQSAICLLQLYGGNPLGLYPEGLSYFDAGKAYSGAFLGTVGNVDFLGSYYCLALPMLWAAVVRLKSSRRFLLLIPFALGFCVIVKMQVLSCFAGVLIGGAAALPFVLPAKEKTRRALGIGILALGAAAVLLLWFADFGDGAAHSLHLMLHGQIPGSVDSGRLYIWREVLLRARERLLFGFGPDTLSLAKIAPFERYDPDLNLLIQGGIDAAHNEYLNILFHQGIPALAAYLGALALALVSAWKQSRSSAAAAILTAAFLGYAVQAFFNISVCYVASLYWAVLGLLAGCGMIQAKGK